eukprot:scaffold24288_cov18-Tisochrysis_lutea.AAC.1
MARVAGFAGPVALLPPPSSLSFALFVCLFSPLASGGNKRIGKEGKGVPDLKRERDKSKGPTLAFFLLSSGGLTAFYQRHTPRQTPDILPDLWELGCPDVAW